MIPNLNELIHEIARECRNGCTDERSTYIHYERLKTPLSAEHWTIVTLLNFYAIREKSKDLLEMTKPKAQTRVPIARGSKDGYWVREEDWHDRPDKERFTELFYAD